MDFGAQFNWSDYWDAQGPSTKTPGHLKGLFNPDQACREASMSSLYTTLFHQGVRFEASVKAVPIFFDIIERGDCPSLPFVVEYLLALAYGYTADIGPDGVDPARRIVALRQETSVAPDQRNPCASLEPFCEPAVALSLYESIYERRLHLAALLNHQEPQVVSSALIATALLCANDAIVRQRVMGRLHRAMVGEAFEVRAAAVIAVGAMARAADDAVLLSELSRVYEEQEDQRLRYLAAIGLATPETIDEYREALTWGLSEWNAKDAPSIKAVWASPEWLASERITQCLRGADEERLGRWVEGFASRVEGATGQSGYAAAAELLRLIRPGGDLRFGHCLDHDLTASQRRGLEALRDAGLWGEDEAEQESSSSAYLNYLMLLKSFGLPASRVSLTAYLNGEEGPSDWVGPI